MSGTNSETNEESKSGCEWCEDEKGATPGNESLVKGFYGTTYKLCSYCTVVFDKVRKITAEAQTKCREDQDTSAV